MDNGHMALQGDLQTLPLRDVLGWLSTRRASGTLSLSRGRVARRFQLRAGRVMLSTSTEEEMLLGRLLMARGFIDSDQLQSALSTSNGVRPRQGTALIRAGLVSAADLRGVLTEKIRRLLLDALAWQDGGFYFDDTPPAPKRPTIAAVVGLADVLAATDFGPSAAALTAGEDEDDVIVTDEDIIEIIELTQPRRPPKAPPRKRRASRRRKPDLAAANQDGGESPPIEAGVQPA
jgi:hypothetical protein